MTTAQHWSPEENAILIDGYLRMLRAQLMGEPINKSGVEKETQARLPRRSLGSVRWKLRNVSAAMLDLNYWDLGGYQPAWNYQRSKLERAVLERLAHQPEIDQLMSATIEAPPAVGNIAGSVLDILQAVPKTDEKKARRYGESLGVPNGINWIEAEARRRDLGQAGEDLVLRFEAERLHLAGKRTLADRIEHVSRTQGDGLGYDILSFEESGRERLIEVKTTSGGAYTPFLVSRNEVEVSDMRSDLYHLYRLYGFRKSPKLYQLSGSMKSTCDLDPVSYRGRVAATFGSP